MRDTNDPIFVWGCLIFEEFGVEFLDGIEVTAGGVCDFFESCGGWDFDGIEFEGRFQHQAIEAEGVGIFADDCGGEDFGGVSTRFVVHGAVGDEFKKVVRIVFIDCGVYESWTSVISGHCEGPRIITIILFFKIFCGGMSGFNGIESFIDPCVDAQSLFDACCGHELPHAASGFRAFYASFETAFDHGEVEQVAREAFIVHDSFDDFAPFTSAFEPDFEAFGA